MSAFSLLVGSCGDGGGLLETNPNPRFSPWFLPPKRVREMYACRLVWTLGTFTQFLSPFLPIVWQTINFEGNTGVQNVHFLVTAEGKCCNRVGKEKTRLSSSSSQAVFAAWDQSQDGKWELLL